MSLTDGRLKQTNTQTSTLSQPVWALLKVLAIIKLS